MLPRKHVQLGPPSLSSLSTPPPLPPPLHWCGRREVGWGGGGGGGLPVPWWLCTIKGRDGRSAVAVVGLLESVKHVNTAESSLSLLGVCWRGKSDKHVNAAQSCPFVGGERVLNM